MIICDSDSRLGADEARRREGLKNAEVEAKTAGKGIWAEGGESVSCLLLLSALWSTITDKACGFVVLATNCILPNASR